jgi:hypothetical protein
MENLINIFNSWFLIAIACVTKWGKNILESRETENAFIDTHPMSKKLKG